MGNPAYKPSADDRSKVETMSGLGIRLEDIARVMDIGVTTLQKYYRRELDTGHVKANTQVAQSLFQKAIGTGPQAVTAAIFWLKCRMPETFGQVQAAVEYVSKKEEATWAAKRAGLGTEWGDDLTTPAAPKDLN